MTSEILPVPVDDWNHIIDSIRYSMSPLIRAKGTSVETWLKLAS